MAGPLGLAPSRPPVVTIETAQRPYCQHWLFSRWICPGGPSSLEPSSAMEDTTTDESPPDRRELQKKPRLQEAGRNSRLFPGLVSRQSPQTWAFLATEEGRWQGPEVYILATAPVCYSTSTPDLL